MKKRVAAALMAGLMAVSVLGGCKTRQTGSGDETGQVQNNAEKTGEKETIRILTTNPLVSEESIKKFMSDNPNIEVKYEYVSPTDYSAKFSALAAADNIPDVFWTQSSYYTDQVKQGLLMDLTEELEGKSYEADAVWKDTFVPSLLENAQNMIKKSLKEKNLTSFNYGVPFTMTTVAAVYDKNVYAKLGLKEPQTWEEFMNNCQALKENGYVPISLVNDYIDWYPRMFWDQYCREELDRDPDAFADGSMTFGSESVVKGLESYKELYEKGYFPENGLTANVETMQQMFIQGKLGQFLLPPSRLEYIVTNAPDTMDIASFVVPGIDGLPSRAIGGSSNIFAVSATTKHKEASVKLLKYLTSKTNFESNDSLKYTISGLSNVKTSDSLAELLKGFNTAANNGFTPDIYVPVNISSEMNTTVKSDLLPNYLSGSYSTKDVCDKLQELYNNR